MGYDDEAIASVDTIEEMAKAYGKSLKQKGFVFINLEEHGKNLLVDEVFDLLFKLRASYRYLGTFLDSNKMLSITETHIASLRELFNIEENKGFFVANNRTKCFLNTVSLENALAIKLLLLSQKCEYGEKILSLIIERAKTISQNLSIENTFSSKNF